MTTSFESGCSAWHIGQQEAAQDAYWHQANIEGAAEEVELNERCIHEIAEDHGVTVTEVEEYLNMQGNKP